jgi:hypothetical protein
MHTRRLASSLVLATLLAASPALAVVESIVGTWDGVLKCELLADGVTTKTKIDETVHIEAFGMGSGHSLHLVQSNLDVIALVYPDAKPGTGVITGASCLFAWDELVGGMLQGDVKTKAGSDKASMKVRLTLMDAAVGTARSCTLTAKRTSTKAPIAPGCAKP